jgi:hypothetical protein
MKALSGRQPWWWAILHAGKRIENRVWNTSYRGPILLHAAKGCTKSEFIQAVHWMIEAGVLPMSKAYEVPTLERMRRGGIVGRARIVDVIPPGGLDPQNPRLRVGGVKIDDRWHMSWQFGFVLADVEPLPFFACAGSLGIFNCEVPGLAETYEP